MTVRVCALDLSFFAGLCLQNLMIQENCPGKDGKEYMLRFTVDVASEEQLSIPPYELPFLFYNGK